MTKPALTARAIVLTIAIALPTVAAAQPARASTAIAIAAGGWHTCALAAGGGALCWGFNATGDIGDGTTTDRWTPTAVVGLSGGVAAVAAGEDHTCAVTTGGAAFCWGYNGDGEVGDGTTTDRRTPTAVSGLGGSVAAIAAGVVHTCALTSGGGVFCWGANDNGELGDGTGVGQSTPVAVSGLGSGVAAIVAGDWHTCALTSAGAVLCWGYNGNGQLGDGTTTDRSTPVAVSGLAAIVTAIAAGAGHTCALTTGGGVACWGWNAYGQLGDMTTTARLAPTPVHNLTSGVASVAAGDYHTCAVTTSGAALCWGDNEWGQLGDGTATSRLVPVSVSGLDGGVAEVAAGMVHTCAVTAGGSVECWGWNSFGQLGDGTTTERLTATPVDLAGIVPSGIVVFRPASGEWLIDSRPGTVTFGQAGDIPVVADYNGDGKPEVAVFRPSTSEWIIQGQAPVVFGQAGDVPVPGDYDGDGRAEMAVFRPSTGAWIVAGQAAPTLWGMRGDIPVPADYNGDGVTEIAVFRPTTGVWYVMGGETLVWGMWGDVPVPADYNGDGKAEIAVYRPSTGWWYVARGPMAMWGAPGDVPVPLDLDGDGRTEFVVFRPSDGTWYALNAATSATTSTAWGKAGDTPVGQPPQLPATPILKTAGDFDHDGAADVTVFRPSDGGWYTLESTHAYRTFVGVTLGQPGDVPVPGDYQGTGRQERAVYRPSSGQWFLEDGRSFTLGTSTDVPVPGDYDGDAITDIAVFTPGTARWSILTGASGFTTLVTETWGASGDVPAPGDFDRDGKTDFAVFTPATGVWKVRSSKTGSSLITVQFGMNGDVAVPGDYDGDGAADIAVYRPATGYWYVLTSSSGFTSYEWHWWGAVGDVPVPGDFDGDGRTDVSVYRPSTGTWYVMDVMTIAGWGETGDVPVLRRQ